MKKISKKSTKKSVAKKASKKVAAKKVTAKKSTKKKVAQPVVKVKKPKVVEKTKKTKVESKSVVKQSKPQRIDKNQQELDSKDPEVLLDGRRHPRGWKIMTYEQKLDYIASRIIAEDRHGITSHKELKESGILSTSQYERRRNREVYSQTGDLDSVKVKPGVFSRAHVRDLRGVRNIPNSQIIKDTVDE